MVSSTAYNYFETVGHKGHDTEMVVASVRVGGGVVVVVVAAVAALVVVVVVVVVVVCTVRLETASGKVHLDPDSTPSDLLY